MPWLVGATAPEVSQHLGTLPIAGMVSVRREGTYASYLASDQQISHTVSLLVDDTTETLGVQHQANTHRKQAHHTS